MDEGRTKKKRVRNNDNINDSACDDEKDDEIPLGGRLPCDVR